MMVFIGCLCAVCEIFMYMHVLHIHTYRQAQSIYIFEYIHWIYTHILRAYRHLYSIYLTCVYPLSVCMYVCVYVSPTCLFFFGRLHTDTIIPSFLSNPRLGSPDRQPRESILCRSRQPNHHVAAPHSRSNTRWDPQVWLYPANGAAEPAVSSCV